MADDIYIIDGVRTPIGSPFKGLKNFTAAQLGAAVIKKIIHRNKIKKSQIDEVIFGNTVAAGTGQNLARQAAMLAGLPANISSYTVNNVCGAGLQSVILAAQAIAADNASIVIAGGAESATKCPLLYPHEAENFTDIKVSKKRFSESLFKDGLFCQFTNRYMGELAETMAKDFKITRQEQDQYSLESHLKACVAQQQAKFLKEIVPIETSGKKVFARDERPRRNINLSNLEILPSAFRKKGTVTAGNSSVPSDGACAVLVASKKGITQNKLVPRARILGYASTYVEPKQTFTSVVKAVKECLKNCRLSLDDIDLFEISEAFAVQVIYSKNKLNITNDKLNIWGGDIALGHALGAAGTRVVITLMNALIDQGKKRGLACISLGGGGSLAMAIEIV